MNFAEFCTQNQFVIDSLVFLSVIIISLFITYEALRFYRLSSYKGFEYFSKSFTFFAVAFGVLLVQTFCVAVLSLYSYVPYFEIFFNYAISIAGLYLVYSLVWKQWKKPWQGELLLHAFALLVVIINYFYQEYYTIFVVQLTIFAIAIIISYTNYASNKKSTYLQMYFIIMVLAFVGYGANFLQIFLLPYYPLIPFYVSLITLSVFVLFLYGVLRTTRPWRKNVKGLK